MSISYHGIIGNKAKATLPSITNWHYDINVLRDPPKMVSTRRIDKVGSTSSITTMIDQASDRACESINTYARGVNPFVSVSYNNYGNNGGARVNGFSTSGQNFAGRQAYKAYRVGVFRPPVIAPQNLLPLSRQPRVWTSSFTQPGFADFSKKAVCYSEGDCLRQIKSDQVMPKTCVRPSATFQIQAPITENYKMNKNIQNPIHFSNHSGVQAKNIANVSEHYTLDPTQIHDNPLHANAQSNKSQNIQITSLEDINDTFVKTKETFTIPYETTRKGHNNTEYIHDELVREKNIPSHTARTNHSRKDIYINPVQESKMKEYKSNRPYGYGRTNFIKQNGVDNISNRTYKLNPTISAGGFAGKAGIPSTNRGANIDRRENLRQERNRKVMDIQQGRWFGNMN